MTIWPPSLDFIRQRVLDQSGTRTQCLGVTTLSEDEAMDTLGDDENFVTDMRSCAVTSMQRIREARDAAIDKAGADVVVMGCTCMAPAAAMLPEHPRGRTIDPMTLGYRFAEYCLSHNVAPEDVDYSNLKQWMT